MIPLLWAAGSEEFIGVGTARVVGGNQVSARQRALAAAREDAVVQAVGTLIDPAKVAEISARLRQNIYSRHAVYVRNYRVVSEIDEGASFRVEVAVGLNIKRLRRDVARLVGGPLAAAAPVVAARPRIAVWFADGDAFARDVRASAALKAAIGAVGFEVAAMDGARGTLAARAKGTGIQVLVFGRLEGSDVEGVRGIDLPGARVALSLEAKMVAGDAPLATIRETAWGAARTPSEARRQATRSALARASTKLAAQFTERWPRTPVRADAPTLRVLGLQSYRQHAQVCEVIERQVTRVQRCRPSALSKGLASYSVKTSLPAETLVKTVAAQVFDGFSLRVGRSQSGELELIATQQARVPTGIGSGSE